MRLLLVRHGRTIENEQHILQGHVHGQLSADGMKQVQHVAERLKNEQIDIIYSSDLQRSVDTANTIAVFHPKIQVIQDEKLREMKYGIFSGKPVKDCDWGSLDGDLCNRKPEGGESFTEVYDRVKEFYSSITQNHSNETVLLVAHGACLSMLQGAILGLPVEQTLAERFGFHNTGLSEFLIDNKENVKIVCLDCITHLHNG